jgi:hypothetical protein
MAATVFPNVQEIIILVGKLVKNVTHTVQLVVEPVQPDVRAALLATIFLGPHV